MIPNRLGRVALRMNPIIKGFQQCSTIPEVFSLPLLR
jgi:hypothetical protein